jgi:hypothetical protein
MMKAMNLLSAAAMILLASAFAACSSDAVMNEEEAPEQEPQKVSLTVKATQGARTPDTRLLYTPSDDGKSMEVKWGTGEELGVVSYVDGQVPVLDGVNGVLKGNDADANTASMRFSGTGITESTGSTGDDLAGKYNFYYPTDNLNPNLDVTGYSNIILDISYIGAIAPYDLAASPAENLSPWNLMYTEKAVNPLTETITLKHAFALLRFNLTLPEGAGHAKQLNVNTWKDVFPSVLYLEYDAEGNANLFTYNKTSSLLRDIINDDKTGEHSITAYMLIPAVDDFTGLLCRVSIKDDKDDIYSYVYNLTGNTDKDAAVGNLSAEKLYTFTATLKPSRWAESNIYWNGGLTFGLGDTMRAYQGLFFKWGSLQGISPVGAWVGGSTPVYTTTKGTAATWGDIDYDATTASGSLPAANDICEQINSAYRMPTLQEWVDLRKLSQQTIGTAGGTTTDAVNGTGAIYIGTLYGNLVFMPYAGLRDTDGSLAVVGEMDAYYWSNEAYDADNANNNYTALSKTIAMPVRCIKKTAEELEE